MLNIKIGPRETEAESILATRAAQRSTVANGPAREGFGAARAFSCLAVLPILLLGGCQKEDLHAYRIPKEPEKSAAAPARAAEPAASEIVCNAPSGWVQMTPGPMQQALFTVKGSDAQQAQVSVVTLAGAAGGELDNVNRWRGQAKLDPIKAEDLKALTEDVEIAGAPGHLFDLGSAAASGEGGIRILAAILQREGNSWFFKMMGNAALVQEQKTTFKEFLKGIRFRQDASAQPTQATATSPMATNSSR
jgi:hypothetical protein